MAFSLPVHPPLPPMEAESVDAVPVGPQWQYEPKWDGFRCLLFREGDRIELQSKAERSLTRYFPEIVTAAKHLKADRFVLDGELVVPVGSSFSFDDLLQRIHPAQSRVTLLAKETPALLIVFDLLVNGEGDALAGRPLAERRAALEVFAHKHFKRNGRFRLSPATPRLSAAKSWLKHLGGALDGVVAKRRDLPYRAGQRDAVQKIKNLRSADCVVGGFRVSLR